MMKEWMVKITEVEFVIANSEKEAIEEARNNRAVSCDAIFMVTEINGRTSEVKTQ